MYLKDPTHTLSAAGGSAAEAKLEAETRKLVGLKQDPDRFGVENVRGNQQRGRPEAERIRTKTRDGLVANGQAESRSGQGVFGTQRA